MSFEQLPTRASDAGPEPDNTPVCDVCGLSFEGHGGHEHHGKIVHDGDCYDIIRGKAFRCSCCGEVTGINEGSWCPCLPGDRICWVCGSEGEYQDKIAAAWRVMQSKLTLYESALTAFSTDASSAGARLVAQTILEAAKEIK